LVVAKSEPARSPPPNIVLEQADRAKAAPTTSPATEMIFLPRFGDQNPRDTALSPDRPGRLNK
jgi:hypothetical protein